MHAKHKAAGIQRGFTMPCKTKKKKKKPEKTVWQLNFLFSIQDDKQANSFV